MPDSSRPCLHISHSLLPQRPHPTNTRNHQASKGIRINFGTEEHANMVRDKNVDWNQAFQGLKVQEPSYGVVIHGVPIAELSAINMTDTEVIKHVEAGNGMKAGTITKITPLRRKNLNNSSSDSNKVKLHHSIILHTNDQQIANRCITNGCCIEYRKYAPAG